QGRDDAVPVHESRQGETEAGEFFVVRAHPTHGDESNSFHKLTTSQSVSVPAERRQTTGIKNSARKRGRCAMIKQQTGMVTAPATNPHDATVAKIGRASCRERE